MNRYTDYMVVPDEARIGHGKDKGDCPVNFCHNKATRCTKHRNTKDGVTQEKALEVLKEIAEKHGIKVEDAIKYDLFMTSWEHEELRKGVWAIAWEGGPEDWAFHDTDVPGVFTECYSSWQLRVYPA